MVAVVVIRKQKCANTDRLFIIHQLNFLQPTTCSRFVGNKIKNKIRFIIFSMTLEIEFVNIYLNGQRDNAVERRIIAIQFSIILRGHRALSQSSMCFSAVRLSEYFSEKKDYSVRHLDDAANGLPICVYSNRSRCIYDKNNLSSNEYINATGAQHTKSERTKMELRYRNELKLKYPILCL